MFLTNFLAILLAGGGILALLGLSAATMKDLNREARCRAFILIAIGVPLVIIPLGATTVRVFKQYQIMQETKQLAEEWMEGTGYGISRIDVSGEWLET